MTDPVIQISNLTRRFGTKTALDSVSLSLPRGAVYGLVGANGAGKTTLIRHILGLLKAEVGSVTVFGLDPVADPVSVLSRIGYLSEENDLPGWMRVDELMRYTRAFYPRWDAAYAEELRQAFHLDPAATGRMSYTARGDATPKPPYEFHFPDGNASVARLLVRPLEPGPWLSSVPLPPEGFRLAVRCAPRFARTSVPIPRAVSESDASAIR